MTRLNFSSLIICLILVGNSGHTQSYKTSTEIGVYGGGSYYLGDLNLTRHFVDSKPAFGLIYRYNLSLRHSFRVTGFYGGVQASDANSNDPFQLNRNLSFKSKLIEIGVGYELCLGKYTINSMKYPISPYFFYQLAYTRINPTTDFDGNEVALQPLGTEGQGTSANNKRPYSLNQLTVPLGLGVKITLKKRWAVSFEYGIRKTFTDYLDDVSGNYVSSEILRTENGPLAATLANRSLNTETTINRGNPNNKDWYVFYGIMLTFKPFQYNICKDIKGN